MTSPAARPAPRTPSRTCSNRRWTSSRSAARPSSRRQTTADGAAGEDWSVLAGAGDVQPAPVAAGALRRAHRTAKISSRSTPATRLVLSGRILPASDRRLLGAFGVHLAAQLERQQLAASRREILRLAESNTMRTSILRAVSHDLRTPLAGIKLAVGRLLQTRRHTTPRRRNRSCWPTIDECSDRLDLLVGNLLDMSRITSDAAKPLLRPLRWYEVIPAALHGIPAGRVRMELPPNMPEIDADPGHAGTRHRQHRRKRHQIRARFRHRPRRNRRRAQRRDPPGAPRRRTAHHRSRPGRPGRKRRCNVPALPAPRRHSDRPPASGLGLAVAKGFTEAMGGTLTAEQTPGGGLTMVIRLPLSTGRTRRRQARAGTPGPAVVPGQADHGTPIQPSRTEATHDRRPGRRRRPAPARVLKIALQANGYSVTTATDGRSALLAATQHPLGCRHPGPRPARHRRHRRDHRNSEAGTACPSWCCPPATVRRQGRGPRRRSRRLPHQTLRTWTSSWPGSAPCCAGPPTGTSTPSSPPTTSPSTWPSTASPATAQDVRLTPIEWNILEILVRNPEKLITQRQLLTEVWGPAYAKDSNYLRVYMAQLRRKLERTPATPATSSPKQASATGSSPEPGACALTFRPHLPRNQPPLLTAGPGMGLPNEHSVNKAGGNDAWLN